MKRGMWTFAALIFTVSIGAMWRAKRTSAQSIAPAALSSSSTLPAFGHVVIVVEENHSFSEVVGSSSMPYLNSLIGNGGLATNYFADTHPSIGNYFMLTDGIVETNDDSLTPCSFTVSHENIASLAEQAGKTWKSYAESFSSSYNTSTCSQGNHFYIRHVPLAYYTNINRANVTDFSQFATDLSGGRLPNFSFITPNGNDDAHDGSLSTADTWLKNNVGVPLLNSSYFQAGGDGLLIVVFDEDDGTQGNQVAWVAVSPSIVSAGFQSSVSYKHENTLQTMAQGLGLATSGLGAAANAAAMSDFFKTSTSTGSVSLSPTSLSFSNVTVGTSVSLPVTLTNGTSSAVSVTSIGISPTTSGFTQTNNCPTGSSTFAAGSNCTISVTFTPTITGSLSATLSVTAGGTTLAASLTGSGVASTTGSPVVSFSPTSLTFPSTTVGTASAAQAVTLSNTGNAPLSITGISTMAPFAETNNCPLSSSTLAAGASCTINVTFTPTVSGTATGTLSVTDNASGSPQTVGLTGTGATSSSGSGGGTSATCPTGSTSFYVSTSGSDSTGNGSSTSPWATIQFASTKIGAGACVHVAAGTYISNDNLLTTTSGTTSARITYISDTPWGAKIVNNTYTCSGSTCNEHVWDNEGSYVTIQGFDLSGDAYQGIGNGGSNVQIIGNHVHNIVPADCNGNGGAGIADHGTSSDDIGNVVHDVANFPLGACGYIHGIYANRTGGHISNNIVYHNWSNGIQLWGAPQAVTISGNAVLNNGLDGIVYGTDTKSAATSNMLVTDNIFAYNGNYGFDEQGYTGTGNQFIDNLSYGNGLGFFSLLTGTQTGTVEANPLFVSYTGSSDPVLSLPGDPANYFELQSISPAINAGTSQGAPSTDYAGNARPQTRSSGNGWDIGAYEFMGTVTSAPGVGFSPTSLTFPSTTVGTTSAAQTVTLTNTGSASLAITSVSATAPFAQTNNCPLSPSTLAAGGTCTISVTFTPTVTGTATGTVSVADNASGSPQTVGLSGSGASSSTGSGVSITPNPLTFPNTAIGTTSSVQSATLTNNTGSALSITNPFTITGAFAFAGSGNCPAVGGSVASGGSCTLSVDFTPTATGTFTGTVTVFDSAGSQTLSLSGTGVSSTTTLALSLSATSLNFGRVAVGATSAPQVVTVKNTGSGAVTISSVVATAPFAQTNNCVGSLAVGGSCMISVTFTPQTKGSIRGSLAITDNATGSPQMVSLNGRGGN